MPETPALTAVAPAPDPAPAPAAPAPETPSAEPSPQDNFDSHFDDLAPAAPIPQSGVKPAQPAAPAKGVPSTPAKPGAPAPAAKTPPATPGEFDEEDGIQVPRFKKDKEFRGWGLNGYKKANQFETELKAMREKHAQLEQQVPKTLEERNQLAEKLKTLETRLNEKEESLKYLNYELSEEFKTKYEAPYKHAWGNLLSDLKELTVAVEDRSKDPDIDGKYPMTERPATRADFDEIYGAQLGAATKLAHAKFGPSAGIVLAHRSAIRNAATNATTALNEWKTKGAERAKEEEERTIRQNSEIQRTWESANKKVSEDPRGQPWWGKAENDKEINEALDKGFAYADQRFSDSFFKLPVAEQVHLDAQIRHRVAGFFKMRVLLERANKELATAQEELKVRRGSSPGPANGDAGAIGENEDAGAVERFEKLA
jgi:hypothetical protein